MDENITYQNKEVSYNWKPANLCPTNDCASIENLGAGKYGLTIKLTYTITPLLIRTDSIVFDLIEVIEELDDVQNVYGNFDVSDEVMASLS